jgi:hypothetical protein
LHIYEDEFLEDPAPLAFLAEEYVEDVEDAPILVPPLPHEDPACRWNFMVRREGLFAELRRLLLNAGYDPGRKPPSAR